MGNRVGERLAELGIVLPKPAMPVANYVPFVRTGELVFVAGQIPLVDGRVEFVGKVGADLDLEAARAAARAVALNVLAQLAMACDGDLDRVRRCVRLNVFVNAAPDFTQHPQVANAASDLIVEVLGEAGRHTRAAVGVGSLPFGVAVEIDGVFEVG